MVAVLPCLTSQRVILPTCRTSIVYVEFCEASNYYIYYIIITFSMHSINLNIIIIFLLGE